MAWESKKAQQRHQAASAAEAARAARQAYEQQVRAEIIAGGWKRLPDVPASGGYGFTRVIVGSGLVREHELQEGKSIGDQTGPITLSEHRFTDEPISYTAGMTRDNGKGHGAGLTNAAAQGRFQRYDEFLPGKID